MYNTKIICTYNSPDIFLESDQATDSEKEFVRDAIYRQELLNILGMDEFNEKEMDRAIHELYEKLQSCPELKECMMKLASNFMSTDEELGLMILFAYDFMYLTHDCVRDFLEEGKISEQNLIKLKSIVY
jgi:hypothetical protein